MSDSSEGGKEIRKRGGGRQEWIDRQIKGEEKQKERRGGNKRKEIKEKE